MAVLRSPKPQVGVRFPPPEPTTNKYCMSLLEQIKNSIDNENDPLNFSDPMTCFGDGELTDAISKEYWCLVTYHWHCGERLAFEIYRDFLSDSNLGYYTDEELMHFKRDEAKHFKISRAIYSAIADRLPDTYFYESFLGKYSKDNPSDVKKVIAMVTFTEFYAQTLLGTWRKFGRNAVINELLTEILHDEHAHFVMSSRIFKKVFAEATTQEKFEMLSSIKELGFQRSLFSVIISLLASKYPQIQNDDVHKLEHERYFNQIWTDVVKNLLGEKSYKIAFALT